MQDWGMQSAGCAGRRCCEGGSARTRGGEHGEEEGVKGRKRWCPAIGHVPAGPRLCRLGTPGLPGGPADQGVLWERVEYKREWAPWTSAVRRAAPSPPMDEGPRRKMNSDARRLSFPKTRLACVLLRNRRSILVLRTHTPRRGSTTHRPGRSSNEAWTSESGGWMRRTTQWSSTSSACHPPLRTPCAAY